VEVAVEGAEVVDVVVVGEGVAAVEVGITLQQQFLIVSRPSTLFAAQGGPSFHL
jgi:aspartate oxidase